MMVRWIDLNKDYQAAILSVIYKIANIQKLQIS